MPPCKKQRVDGDQGVVASRRTTRSSAKAAQGRAVAEDPPVKKKAKCKTAEPDALNDAVRTGHLQTLPNLALEVQLEASPRSFDAILVDLRPTTDLQLSRLRRHIQPFTDLQEIPCFLHRQGTREEGMGARAGEHARTPGSAALDRGVCLRLPALLAPLPCRLCFHTNT